jgi:hypothetical protein
MDVKKGVRSQFRGMFDGMKERTRRDQAAIDAEEAKDDAFREQSRGEADLAWRRLQHILRGGQPSRDPNWNPQPTPGMLAPRSSTVGGVVPVKSPSELMQDNRQGYHPNNKKMPQEYFLAAPVTDTERKILGLARPGMLHQLNKQALDRDLNDAQQYWTEQRAKPKSM